jgi:hypothetical protein
MLAGPIVAHALHSSRRVPRPRRLDSRVLWFRKEEAMLYTIAVVLLVLWLLGLVSGYTIGAFIHVLLVMALVLFLVGFVSGRRIA